MTVSVGDVVLYRLSGEDVNRVYRQRTVTAGFVGDTHRPSDLVPLVVTNVHDDGSISGQAVLFGNDSLAVRDSAAGPNDGEWSERD